MSTKELKHTSYLLFFFIFSIFIFTLSGCGGGDAVTTAPPATTATINGKAEVPSGVQTAKAGGFLYFVKSLFVREAEAVTDKKPLYNKDVPTEVTMNVLNKEGTLVAVPNIPPAVTNEQGNFTITDVPVGDNYVIQAALVTPQGKTVKVYDITSVTSADLGAIKSGTTADVEGVLALGAVIDIVKSTGKDLKDVDKYAIEDIETKMDATLATDETTTKLVDPASLCACSGTTCNLDFTTIKTEIDELKAQYAELKSELDEILTKGTIAGEVKNSSGTALSGVTITISGGGLTSSVTTTTNLSGQYSYSVGSSPTAYTVTATLSGYNDATATATVSNSTVIVSNITMTAVTTPSGCPTLTSDQQTQVASYITTARNSLFKTSISSTDFDAAKSAITSALALDSCNPDANLIGAAIDIGAEIERIKQTVVYTTGTIFPFLGGYSVQKNLMSRALEPVANTFISPISGSSSFGSFKTGQAKFTSDDPKPSEIQAEIEANTMPVVDGIITKLEKVKTYTDSNTSWAFSYPKDPANTVLGNNLIDKSDVKAMIGAVKLIRGFAYAGLAYDWDTPSTWTGGSDSNGDGTKTPSEYFPPSPFGTLKSKGTTYLSNAKSDVSSGLTSIRDALNDVLAETSPSGGGVTLTSQAVTDINKYKHYLDELVSSFSGTATNITLPDTKECWNIVTQTYSWGSYTYLSEKTIFDPSYNNTTTCGFSVTGRPQTTMSVNFSALFTPVSDLRSIAYTEVKDNMGGWVIQSFPDNTLNGIFPGGMQNSWFERTTAKRSLYFTISDSNATQSTCDNSIKGKATLAIGSTTFYDSGCYLEYDYTSGYPYKVTGYRVYFQSDYSKLPTSSDVYTFNELYGTSATLSVPGFSSATVLISDRHNWGGATSTAATATSKAHSFLKPFSLSQVSAKFRKFVEMVW